MASAEETAARIRRLERRLDRERRARAEAEQIAERGLRSLYDANRELDERIAQRTVELQEALTAAEIANDAKSRFLAQMSHQINTPLNGLMGMLELLGSSSVDPQSQEWHAAASRSADRLQRITSRLTIYVGLEGADLRQGAPSLALGDVFRAVHDRWHGECLRAGQLLSVNLATSSERQIPAPAELDLLFDEVVSNAVEHGGPGSVTLSGTDDGAGNAVITLSDPGQGFDERELHGFNDLDGGPDQARQADAEITLGLALVNHIVQALGGSWAASINSQPAVTLTIPYA